MVEKLTKVEKTVLERLAAGWDGLSSFRDEDKAKTRLKRLGMVQFDRPTWRWQILPAGLEALAQEKKG